MLTAFAKLPAAGPAVVTAALGLEEIAEDEIDDDEIAKGGDERTRFPCVAVDAPLGAAPSSRPEPKLLS